MRLDPGNDDHAAILGRLGSEVVIWLSTVRDDGQPQPSPVWFLWEDGSFLIFSQPSGRKLDNIARNPRVALHLRGTETGEDIAIFEGTAERRDDQVPADRVPRYVEKYRDHIAGYGWTPESFAADYSVPIRVTPERLRSW